MNNKLLERAQHNGENTVIDPRYASLVALRTFGRVVSESAGNDTKASNIISWFKRFYSAKGARYSSPA